MSAIAAHPQATTNEIYVQSALLGDLSYKLGTVRIDPSLAFTRDSLGVPHLSIAQPPAFSAIGFQPLATDQGQLPYAPTLPAAAYFVSPSGSDTAAGTQAAPFASLAHAQAVMRTGTVKALVLRGGQYSIAAATPLAFTSADNGEAWSAYPGETPVLDAGGNATITVNSVTGLAITGLTIQNIGTLDINSAGFAFSGNYSTVTIRWNTFLNCTGNCMNGPIQNSLIDSNVFNGQTPGNVGPLPSNDYNALAMWGSNNRVTHNLVENTQGGGIAFAAGPNGPPNNNNIVDRNLLQNVNISAFDSGAIYMLDLTHLATGNQITNNVVNGNGPPANQTKAIYLDDAISNVLVSGNRCTACGQFGFQIHGGDHNSIVNNSFDLTAAGSQFGLYQSDALSKGMGGNVVSGNVVYFLPATVLYQVNILTDAIPAVSRNLFIGAGMPNAAPLPDSTAVYSPR